MVARAVAIVSAVLLSAVAGGSPSPLIIGHRGASGHRPEHTFASYQLAAEMGADFIEPDLVATKDGALIARHENEIGGTTDVAVKFPDRKRIKTIDGAEVTGWFTEDFTLADIKTLRAKERLPFRSHTYDGQFEIPTFDEVIEHAQKLGKQLGRPIGVYPETKHPAYFRSIGLPLEDPLLASLTRYGWNSKESPVFIQSFEVQNLKDLSRMTKLRLVQLFGAGQPYDAVAAGTGLTYAQMATRAGLHDIAGYADGVGPDKTLYLIPRDAAGNLDVAHATTFVDDAHHAGLVVHPYTFRAENTFLPTDFRVGANPIAFGDLEGELDAFLSLGIDGFFTDQSDIGVDARDAFYERCKPGNRPH